MHNRSLSGQLSRVFARRRSEDECPDAQKERLLRELIEDIQQGAAVWEARRLREEEQKVALQRMLNTLRN